MPRPTLNVVGSLLSRSPFLPQPRFTALRYMNPWPGWVHESQTQMLANTIKRWGMPRASEQQLDDRMPLIPRTHEDLASPSPGNVRGLWIGQSSFLLQFGGLNILTDPVFAPRTWMFGHKRLRDPAINLKDLPDIDLILISHSHADHLDESVVQHFHDSVDWVVPQGLGSWFKARGIASTSLTETTWWDHCRYERESSSDNEPDPEAIDIIALPMQHHTQRTPFDKNTSLWCGFALQYHAKRICFIADSGYCPVFKDIGRELGPFDMGLIPVGAYEPRETMRYQHMNPEDAVQVHKDIRASRSFGMHWGTFQYSSEDIFEPPERLERVASEQGVDFKAPPHGSMFEL